MTGLMIKNTYQFDGVPIAHFTHGPKLALIGLQFGTALAYANGGKRFVNKITGEWASEFIEGFHYAILRGQELADFKALIGLGPESGLSRAPALLILYEPGVHLALLKTNKAAGKRFRKFYVEEVMPQIARDGAYLPEREVKQGKIVDKPGADAKALRESRLAAREKRLSAKDAREERTQKADAMDKARLLLAHSLSSEAQQGLIVRSLEMATGETFNHLKPTIEPGWLQASQVAELLGTTAWRVGFLRKRMGYTENIEGMCRCVLNTTDKGRNVEMMTYSPKAVAAIETALRDGGHIE